MYRNEDYFEIFGRISIFFATLDFLTTTLIIKITKNTSKIKITDNTTLGQKFRILKNLNEDDVTEINLLFDIKSIVDEAIAISGERNRFIHDLWLFDNSDIPKGIIYRHRVTGISNREIRIHEDVVIYKISDLYETLSKIGKMQNTIGNFLKRIESN